MTRELPILVLKVRGGDTHRVPLTAPDPEHVLSIDCWCRPYRDEKEPRLIIHRKVAYA